VTLSTPDMVRREYGRTFHSRRGSDDGLAGTKVTDRALPLVRTSPSSSQVSETGPSVLHTALLVVVVSAARDKPNESEHFVQGPHDRR
jgi:hypothetical protein